jgi:hypothetical protein
LSGVDQVKVSIVWELRDNVEISLYIKVELLVELTLGWFLLILVNIDDSPFLVDFTISVLNDNVSVFIVDSS